MKHEEELLVDDYYTVGVAFSEEATAKLYTYKVDDTVKLEVDDLVVVLTSDMQYKIVRVRRIDKEAQINFNSSVTYKYIVDKIDLTTYNRLLARSATINKTLEESKRRSLKKELVTNFKDGLEADDVKALEDAGVKSWL